MSDSLNKCQVIGRLTRDPEVKYTPSGTALCTLGFATTERKRQGAGDYTDSPIFIDVKVFGKQAELCGNHLAKGSQIAIDGRLTMDSWEDKKTGNPRHKLAIIANKVYFLSKLRSGDAGRDPEDQRPPVEPEDVSQDPADYTDENLPF